MRKDSDRSSGALAVRNAILACRKCPLRSEATSPVPFSGPLSPYLAVLGEAPGRTEDREGKPFVGPAGHLLNSILTRNGIHLHLVTYLNSANCYPRTTHTPRKEHLEACRVHLAGQLAAILPIHLLVVGTTALTALVGDRVTMKEVRGRPLWIERLTPFAAFDRPVIAWPTYHPAAALRSSAYRLKIEEDVAAFVKWKKEKGIFSGKCVRCKEEVETWDEFGLAWCGNHSGKQGVLI